MSVLGVVKGIGTQFRSLGMIFMHSFRKRDTISYPEEKPYLPPRYRGRIVLTRDPDGEERCEEEGRTRRAQDGQEGCWPEEERRPEECEPEEGRCQKDVVPARRRQGAETPLRRGIR